MRLILATYAMSLLLLGSLISENEGLSIGGMASDITKGLMTKGKEVGNTPVLSKVINAGKEAVGRVFDQINPAKYLDDIKRIYNHLDFDLQTPSAVKKEEVTFFLYTKDRREIEISINNTNKFPRSYKNYIFIIHGWINDHTTPWVLDMTDAILKNQDNAVVQVDWRSPARDLYALSALNVREVALHVADLIIKLHRERGINLDRVTLIGHSLGAHVSGFTAKKVYRVLNTKIGRIFGLDPAGPLFEGKDEDSRLSKFDAKLVVILHTDGGKFGYKSSFGALDFFANSGSAMQPGCVDADNIAINNITDTVACSHMRAAIYLTEAFNDIKNILALQCDSFETFSNGGCNRNRMLPLVGEDMGSVGDFYFSTHDKPPFILRGLPKIINKLKENFRN